MGCTLKKEKQDNVASITTTKPMLKFKIVFSNIKIKNIPLQKCRVHLMIDDKEYFCTSVQCNNPNPHWRVNYPTEIDIDQESLKQKYFKISVFCAEKNKCFATVTQNMWEVANGPLHYDLFLESTKAKSRITFDLKMVQKTILKIQSKSIICELKDQLMEQAYNFQLKVRSHSIDYYSDFSPKYLNHYLYRKSQVQQYGYIDTKEKLRSESDEFQLVRDIFDSSMDENVQVDMKSCYLKKYGIKHEQELMMKKSKSGLQLNTMIHLTTNPPQSKTPILQQRRPYSTMDLITKKDISWEFKVQENNPWIQLEIYVDEFSSSSFEFILWGCSNPNERTDIDNVRIIGNSIISMNKFFSQNVNVLAELDRLSLQEVRFSDKLWIHGQSIGRVRGEFIITKDTFIRQMLGGFRTEEGIQRSSLLYIKKDKYAGPQNQNISLIIQINMEVDDLISRLSQKSLQHRERVKINKAINNIIEKLITLVKNQELYENLEEMITAQLVLTDLTKNLLESADIIDEDLRDPYYDVLITLLNRDEFYISYLGFDKDLKETFNSRNDPVYIQKNKRLIEQINKKIRIGLHYQNFLHQTFEKIIQKLNQQGQNEKEQLFVNTFLVIAYFRIPAFQDMIKNILKSDSRELKEDFDIGELGMNQYDHTFTAEWNENFYYYLRQDPRYEEHNKQLQSTLNSLDWGQLILKNGVFLKWFQLMLNHYKKAKHPYDLSQTWQGFPGYLIAIKYLLLELKYTNEYPYSDSMKLATISILENENMLNYLMIVILRKTKLYDGIAVFYALDMINTWFDVFKKKNKKIPTDFNYQFLMKGLFMIFDGEHASSISKAILLIFNIFPQMPIEIQKEITDHILEKCFFKFFMYWSKLVRFVFQHFLIYRIQHRLRNYRQESLRDFQKEFECIKLQKQVHTVQEKARLLNHLIYIKYSQIIELVMKIKSKLQQFNQQQESQFQLQLEAKSLKLKLMKKKQQSKQFCKRMESPRNDQIDISFETLKRTNNSLTFSLNDPCYSLDHQDDEKSFAGTPEVLNQSNFDQNEVMFFERSIGSIINLNDLLADIDTDKPQHEKRKSRHSNRNNSVDLNSEKSQKKRQEQVVNPKKLKIFHRISQQDSIHKSLHKELLSYLFPAIQEWQESQANYKRWFQKAQSEIKKKHKPEEQEQQLIDLEPPEIHLYVPKDETENENVYLDH